MRECSLAFMGATLVCSKSSATRDTGARENRKGAPPPGPSNSSGTVPQWGSAPWRLWEPPWCAASQSRPAMRARGKTGRGLLLPAPAAAAAQSSDAGVLPGVYGSLPGVQQVKCDPRCGRA
ncbi:hypothetical protein NDU88_000603 [Pleurodeles waltl]|uniref:Uncharacterized protein n=1 Tax=Pleurodeles waltl TaxID=8319 RepID=A0AAV7UQH3_PLEWA|nr:hypothetical protein NDU88_000603 [Pleurodeles waltl]